MMNGNDLGIICGFLILLIPLQSVRTQMRTLCVFCPIDRWARKDKSVQAVPQGRQFQIGTELPPQPSQQQPQLDIHRQDDAEHETTAEEEILAHWWKRLFQPVF